MPKYRLRFHFPERSIDGLGTLTYADDDEAVRALAELDTDGVPVELWRQERKPRQLAIKAADGSVTPSKSPLS
jgi:hypothetical protein